MPAVTFPTEECHHLLASTKLYCLVTEAHGCEQFAQRCYSTARWPRLELVTTESLDYRVTLCLICRLEMICFTERRTFQRLCCKQIKEESQGLATFMWKLFTCNGPPGDGVLLQQCRCNVMNSLNTPATWF